MKLFVTMLLLFISSIALEASELSLPTRDLNSTNITYNYTSGRSYNVKFEEKGVSYRYLTGSKPEKWWGPFPYQAFKIENNVYFTSWFEKGYGDYVTLLINFNNNLLYGSAILSGKIVHFHGAKLVKVNRK
ncbi:MAG: MoaF N-terminal domain-containing protein [Sulfurovum sp.]|nr:MoaF N-terminal domain-containing protein [Sulfurovum sp.]